VRRTVSAVFVRLVDHDAELEADTVRADAIDVMEVSILEFVQQETGALSCGRRDDRYISEFIAIVTGCVFEGSSK
jgi:hypothetical protein